MVGVDKGGPAIADLGVGRNRRGGSLEQLRRRSGRVAELVLLVAVRQGIAPADLLNKSRCRAEIAAARQLAMYLTHVVLGRSLTEVGTLFGRDRTTVAHACACIEDRRDDPLFDEQVGRLETAIVALAETGSHDAGGLRHARA
jgi:hypothetical protein